MYVFLQNAFSFILRYSCFVWTNIQALYKQSSAVYLSDARVMFMQDTGIEKPD